MRMGHKLGQQLHLSVLNCNHNSFFLFLSASLDSIWISGKELACPELTSDLGFNSPLWHLQTWEVGPVSGRDSEDVQENQTYTRYTMSGDILSIWVSMISKHRFTGKSQNQEASLAAVLWYLWNNQSLQRTQVLSKHSRCFTVSVLSSSSQVAEGQTPTH